MWTWASTARLSNPGARISWPRASSSCALTVVTGFVPSSSTRRISEPVTITPLLVNVQLIRQEVPIMLGASLLLLAFGLDGTLSRWDGAPLVEVAAVH